MKNEENSEDTTKCMLCNRDKPVFFVDNDDTIKDINDQHMPRFLKQLHTDYLSNMNYFQFLRLKPNSIIICNCNPKRHAHTYCITAYVLRTKRIHCKDCKSYYRLQVKSEKSSAVGLMRSLVPVILYFIGILLIIFLVYKLD